jgi:hypothetical protein
VVAVALACLLLLPAAGYGLWRVGERLAPTGASSAGSSGRPAAGASSRPPATDEPLAQRTQAAEQLLAVRGRAVLGRDKAAFLALIDPAEAAFRASQDRAFDQIAKVPLSGWEYDVAGAGPGLRAERAGELPRGAWIVRATLRYTFAGSTSPVDREQYFTLVPRGKRWLLAGDQDGHFSGLVTRRDIWDLGPITVVRGDSSLVIGTASSAALRRYAAYADRSVRDVRRVWRARWNQRPVVIVPRTQGDMATIIDSDGEGLDQIAAVTTGTAEAGPTRGDRVVVNPAAWRVLGDLGRRVVMAHEVTHLATRESTRRAVPIWMSEGFADYVAYQSVDVSVRAVARDVLAQVRDGHTPAALPEDADFDATRGALGPAYEGAWLACRMIAQRYGRERLVQLYLRLADGSPQDVDADLREVLGLSEPAFVARWQSYLRGLA